MREIYSSHVDRIGYSSDTQELHVCWRGGKTSVYTGVPADLANQVSKSWSVGKAIKEQIVDNFPHRYESGA